MSSALPPPSRTSHGSCLSNVLFDCFLSSRVSLGLAACLRLHNTQNNRAQISRCTCSHMFRPISILIWTEPTADGWILTGHYPPDRLQRSLASQSSPSMALFCTIFRARWRWVEAGKQRVVVSLDGAPVAGSPLSVHVLAAPLAPLQCLLPGVDDPQPATSPSSGEMSRPSSAASVFLLATVA